ncbi:hypothetical protein FPZ42_12735 [Mucilaginibacter achroorhodeus]|uniref:Uncharacterized protein n=1 Tax=Mucilaginibacter achroorhodeus TaxID=2599294 RepID=A0A563U2H6_9SPHI|nr:DUF5677 domain-containing protein [Mucilaginibacter achroorhodeus]TWR25459.1 hypothetical protein FPZ42_12735 [Mucilaginibacter achroorhodeus]
MNDNTLIKNHLLIIQKHFKNYNSVPSLDLKTNVYQSVLIASFAKALEFNLFLYKNRSAKNSFFHSPFLRGLCEDLITLKFIGKNFSYDKEQLIESYMFYLLLHSMLAQKSFLDKAVPFQQFPLFKDLDTLIETREAELKNLMKNNGLNKERLFPSVEHMAIDAQLKHLYDFLYHATSRMVHFSPNILLRMGWYKKDGPTVFSTHNFHKYYDQFNKFYAAYLLLEFCDSFKKQMKFKEDILKEFKQIKKILLADAFYPELVTFEELNMKRPSNLFINFLTELAKQNPDRDVANDSEIKRVFGKLNM